MQHLEQMFYWVVVLGRAVTPHHSRPCNFGVPYRGVRDGRVESDFGRWEQSGYR